MGVLAAGVPHHQSFEITSRADRVGMLGQTELSQVLRYVPAQLLAGTHQTAPPVAAPAPKSSGPASTPVDHQQIEAAVKAFISQQATPLTGAVDHTTKRIDSAVDRSLLHHVFTELGHGRLTGAEKIYARQVFRQEA